jgi:hypothetical protein
LVSSTSSSDGGAFLRIIARASLHQSYFLLILFYFGPEPKEIVLFFDEILIDLAEEGVILHPAEPLNPPDVGILAEL